MSGGGGGGAPAWIISYADMITLLMTFFIVLSTFAFLDMEKMKEKKQEIVGGKRGTGPAGPKRSGLDRNQVLVRPFPLLGMPDGRGSEIQPLYSDPDADLPEAVVANLLRDPAGDLRDSYEVSVPATTLFAGAELAPAGQRILWTVARQIDSLPYEVRVQVEDASDLSRAALMYDFLAGAGKLSPTRLGIATRPGAAGTFRLHFLRTR